MKEIDGNEKLCDYSQSFNSFFPRTYHGYITVTSGLVQMADQTPTPICILTSAVQKVPMFGEIFGFFQQGISKVYEIKTTNEATRMLQLASNATEMDNMVENVERAVTLDQDKKQEILTVQDKMHLSSFSIELKAKFMCKNLKLLKNNWLLKMPLCLLWHVLQEKLTPTN